MSVPSTVSNIPSLSSSRSSSSAIPSWSLSGRTIKLNVWVEEQVPSDAVTSITAFPPSEASLISTVSVELEILTVASPASD